MSQGIRLGYHHLCLSAGQGCEDQVRREIKPIKQPVMINNPIKSPMIVFQSGQDMKIKLSIEIYPIGYFWQTKKTSNENHSLKILFSQHKSGGQLKISNSDNQI